MKVHIENWRQYFVGQIVARPLMAVFVGVVCVSSGAIFVRLVEAPGVTVALYRMVFASIVLAPWTYRTLLRSPLTARNAPYAIGAGVALAAHFATWISSLSYTSVAASVALVNTNALWTAFLSWLFLGYVPPMTVLVGAALAVFGGALIGFDGASIGSHPALGNGLALMGAVTVAMYLLLGRAAQQRGLSLQAYVGTAYTVAALVLLPLPLALDASYIPPTGLSWVWLLLLALVPQVMGHTTFNYAINHVEPTTVTTMILLEPVFSSIMAFFVFAEVPSPMTLVGGGILLAGVILSARNARRIAVAG